MKVLLVEDTDDIRLLLRVMLEGRGCQVVEAADGAEAVELAAGDGFRLILMDLNLPVLDGFKATERIHAGERTRGVPVVAISAHCWEFDWKERAREAGCVECLAKPVEPAQLYRVIERYAA